MMDFEACKAKEGHTGELPSRDHDRGVGAPTPKPTRVSANGAKLQRKSQLDSEIALEIKARRLTLQGSAELSGVDQVRVSRITRGHLRGVSKIKLPELVTKLEYDVKIVVSPASRRVGRIGLHFA